MTKYNYHPLRNIATTLNKINKLNNNSYKNPKLSQYLKYIDGNLEIISEEIDKFEKRISDYEFQEQVRIRGC